MKVLLDMNISPLWVEFFAQHGITAIHWSMIGDPRATDQTILEWARTNDYIIFTHDLDFGTILAVTQVDSPSVFQVRTQNILPEILGTTVLAALQQFRQLLEEGALITVDEGTARARILPLRR
jgi:predicted nuclease of predicted toxin-antitoxin system